MKSSSTRRRFLKQSALASTGFWVAGGLDAAPQNAQPNDRINVAVIGCGGQGASDLGAVAKTNQANIVALCDVDEQRAAATYKQYPKAAKYADFRVMFDKQKDIDAVVVATPDHVHALASIMAMRRGKHVYCEKPLCHSISECRLMKETAMKHKVATQMGNQHTATNSFRRAVEIVQAGTIGDVREVHLWTNRPTWPQNINRPKGTPAVPKTLNWDLWLGPAPQRPYNPAYLPFNWRGFWDFGTGALGDMGCHIMNFSFMALRLGYPTSVSAELDTPLIDETFPMGCRITYQFPARGKLPPVTLYWYERRRPPEKLLQGQKPTAAGHIMIGSRGTIHMTNDNASNLTLLPANQFQGFQDPPRTLTRSPGHQREWLDAARGGRPALSNFVDYASLLTETVLLGNLAIRVGGKRIVWDAEKMRVVDTPAADRFIRRDYRKRWSLSNI